MSCGCNTQEETTNREVVNSADGNNNAISIDFLFLDLSVCTRCQGTEETLEDSIISASALLKEIGYNVNINKVHVETAKQAIQHQFVSSPTIRINGQDIQMDVTESHCSTCSSLTDGASVDCREWNYKGETYSIPPRGLIIDGVLSSIYRNQVAEDAIGAYEMPQNLVEYFQKKDQLCAAVDNKQIEDCGCTPESDDDPGCC